MTTGPDALPERVRARVVAYAADALGLLPPDHVPAPLKRAAMFAPARRARTAGQQIWDQVVTDDTFRERVGVQALARNPDVAVELADGVATVESAALAYLSRPDGWEDVVTATTARLAESSSAGAEPPEVRALRRRLDSALADVAAVKEASRVDLAAARSEVAALRRKLGESRKEARTARSEAERATAQTSESTARLQRELTTAEGEIRRLRTQVVGLETELAKSQRAKRTQRDEGTLRARLLLDTLLQAAQGLRHELALPVVHGSPADQVEAHLAETGARDSSGAASLAADDPALVRELLALPRVHLVIDGYNVTRLEWDDTPLEAQRARLLRGLAPLAARSGAEITVVFDGTNAESRPVVQQPRGVRVLFSPRGVLADDVVRDLVAAEPPGRPVGVVTSDQEIARDVSRQPGVRVIGSRALVRLLG